MRPESGVFVTHQGLHKSSVMPFGLTNVPASLMHLNQDEDPNFIVIYIDDILMFSKMLDDHLKHLEFVHDRLAYVRLKLKSTKCQFLRSEVAFLGHVLTLQGLWLCTNEIHCSHSRISVTEICTHGEIIPRIVILPA